MKYFNESYRAACDRFDEVWADHREWLMHLGAGKEDLYILRNASRCANLVRTGVNWEVVENISLGDMVRILDVLITARERDSHVINEHAEQSFRSFFQDSLDELDELGLGAFK